MGFGAWTGGWPWKAPRPSPDWPDDLQPGSCRPCYEDKDEGGIDFPVEQCTRHRTRRLD